MIATPSTSQFSPVSLSDAITLKPLQVRSEKMWKFKETQYKMTQIFAYSDPKTRSLLPWPGFG